MFNEDPDEILLEDSFFELSYKIQDDIIKDLVGNTDIDLDAESKNKLINKINIGRCNLFLQSQIDKNKPKQKRYKKVLIKDQSN